MKKIKWVLVAVLCALSFGLVACGGEVNTSPTTKYSFSINRNEIVMDTGDTFVLVAVCGDAAVIFETDDDTVATVDESGKITAVSEGETFISAKADGETLSCKVTVLAPEYAIVFDKADEITVAKNAVIEINAALTRDGVEKQTEILWSVTNESGCSMQTNGNTVIFKSGTAGEYVITAKCDKAVGTVIVTVLDI